MTICPVQTKHALRNTSLYTWLLFVQPFCCREYKPHIVDILKQPQVTLPVHCGQIIQFYGYIKTATGNSCGIFDRGSVIERRTNDSFILKGRLNNQITACILQYQEAIVHFILFVVIYLVK